MAWHARLALQYERQGAADAPRTVARFLHEGPLRILQSLHPEGPSICHNVLVHPPSGLVAGDRLDIAIDLAPGTHGVITTPGAGRFYRSEGERATQHVQVRMQEGARLEWLPMEAICYSGCNAENRLDLQLAPGAEFIGWDVTALGLPEPTTGHGSDHGARPDAPDGTYDAFDLKQAIDAVEAWRGKPLTQQQRAAFVVASPWAPSNTMLESMGIEPDRTGQNRFDPKKSKTYEQQVSEATAQLRALGNAAGLNQSTIAAMRPRMSDFQRMLNEATAAHVPAAKLHDYILLGADEGGGGVLSRDDILNQLRGHEAELYTRAVDIVVSRLRRKLEPLDAIKTLRNAGYSLALRRAP